MQRCISLIRVNPFLKKKKTGLVGPASYSVELDAVTSQRGAAQKIADRRPEKTKETLSRGRCNSEAKTRPHALS